eukprot:5627813-Amphidinium_carterae.1
MVANYRNRALRVARGWSLARNDVEVHRPVTSPAYNDELSRPLAQTVCPVLSETISDWFCEEREP